MTCLSGSIRGRVAGNRASAVESGLVPEVDVDSFAAVQRLDAGVADHLSGIAVPGAGSGGTLSGTERVDPFLELHVVGSDAALAPVPGDRHAGLVRGAQHHETAISECRRAGLPDDFSTDVVPVADVHRRLDVHQN